MTPNQTAAESTSSSAAAVPPAAQKKGNKTLIIVLGVVLLLCLCAGIVGGAIYYFSTKALNQAAEQIKQNTDNLTSEDDSSTSTTPETSDPSSLDDSETIDSDVPLYPGADLLVNTTVGGELSAVYSVSASQDELMSYYETNLPANGWTIKSKVNFNAIGYEATKGNRQLVVGILAGEDDSNSTLTISVK